MAEIVQTTTATTKRNTAPTKKTTATPGTETAGTQAEGTQTATYIDDNGERQTGTYSAAGENAGIGNAQESAAPSHYDQMRGYYQQMYDEQVASNEAARAAAEQRAREATQQQIDALKSGYQGTNRQLYRDYMEHRRTLPQEMAARGYSGGMSESSMLRLRNSYEEGLNENERARIGQEAGANAALAQQLYEAQARKSAADQQANQQRLGYLTALQEQQYQDLQQRAATLASAGDFSGYQDLGYSSEEISYLEDIWARQNPALAYSLGKIDAETYRTLTGSYPPGYSRGGGRRYSGGSQQPTGDGLDTMPLTDEKKEEIRQNNAIAANPLLSALSSFNNGFNSVSKYF